MNSQRDLDILVTAVLAFAGGLVAGLFLAPQSGRKLRGMIAERAKAQSRWAERQLEILEERLSEVEVRLRESAHHFAEQAREATHKATDQVFPDLPEDPQDWNIEGSDVTGELRRMPRR